MNTHLMLRILLVALSIIGLAASAGAGTLSLDLEAGYQWISIDGNEDMYRTQVNQDDGFVLRGLRLSFIDPASDGIVDRMVIDAAGFGGEPNGRFRFEAGLGKTYRLRIGYRTMNNFSALPAFANPFVEEGVVPGQHTWDRDREIFDIEFELFPGKSVTPIIGYRSNRIEGPRRTTYHVGHDEFRLDSNLEETEDEFYLGVSFAAGGFVGSLIQGWRDFEGKESVSLVPGGEMGNNQWPVLGLDVEADSIDRTTTTTADTPVTTFHVAGPLSRVVSVRASYVRAEAEGDTMSNEMVSGELVSFRIGRFFEGLDQSISSTTESPSWRGDVEFGFAISHSLNLDVGYEKRHRSMDGWSLISTMYRDTMTFGGLETEDVLDLVETSNSSLREEEHIDARFNFVTNGIFRAWAGVGQTKVDLDLSQDAAEIVTPGAQDGRFERSVSSVVLGTAVDLGRGTVSVDVETENADEPVMRTDSTDRMRIRARFRFPIAEILDLAGTIESLTASNISSGVGYDVDSWRYSIDLGINPTENIAFHVVWDTTDSESSIAVRRPQDFGIEESLHVEDATVLDGILQLTFERFGIDVGYSTFENDGTFEIELERAFARVDFDISDQISAILEYETYEYEEEFFTLADFDSERIGLFFRLTY